jgi:hypothetical protein
LCVKSTNSSLLSLIFRSLLIFFQKKAVLEAVSFTSNGKTATPEQQGAVLQLVRKLETEAPASSTLLSDPNESKIMDGTWYLQYTSPSEVGGELVPSLEAATFNAQGSVSAGGIKVDTSNRVVKQIFDFATSRVINDVELDWGRVLVGGGFRQSPKVSNRAIVSFDTCQFILNNGLTLNFSFLFAILAVVKQTKDLGWLETTFIDEDIRIGRGNKGTMFVLTRDPDAVKP